MKTKEVKNIIRDSLGLEKKQTVNEASVAMPKVYSQNTDRIKRVTLDAHQDIYKDCIDSFNAVSAQLDSAQLLEDLNPDTSRFGMLKAKETQNMNAVWLHELYFANSADVNSEILMESLAYIRLQRDFGTFDDWQKDFIATALVTTNGWAVTGYNFFLKSFQNFSIDGNAGNVPVGVYPVIVLDMWEHASRDYANKRKEYVFGQLKELNWSVIEDRFKRAERFAGAVK